MGRWDGVNGELAKHQGADRAFEQLGKEEGDIPPPSPRTWARRVLTGDEKEHKVSFSPSDRKDLLGHLDAVAHHEGAASAVGSVKAGSPKQKAYYEHIGKINDHSTAYQKKFQKYSGTKRCPSLPPSEDLYGGKDNEEIRVANKLGSSHPHDSKLEKK